MLKVTVCVEGGSLTNVKVENPETGENYPFVNVDIIDEDINSEIGKDRGTITGTEEFSWFESGE